MLLVLSVLTKSAEAVVREEGRKETVGVKTKHFKMFNVLLSNWYNQWTNF